MPAAVFGPTRSARAATRYSPNLVNLCTAVVNPVITGGNGVVSHLYDGNTSNNTYMGGGSTWIMDFLKPYKIEQISMYHVSGSNRCQSGFALYGSYDNRTWTTLRFPSNTADFGTVNPTVVYCNGIFRYIKMVDTGDTQFGSNDWAEWQVWGRVPLREQPIVGPAKGTQLNRLP